MPDPWYQNGLQFHCTRCGNCCTGAPGFVWVSAEEIRAIAEYRGEPVAELTALQTRPAGKQRTLREKANGDCVFYDRAQGCTVYSVRPRQCRTWPFWESTTATPEDWQQTCTACPGAGQGELIPVEEIQRRVAVIRI